MAIKLNFIPRAIAGSLTNFDYYRHLARRPLGESFIYLAILVLIPALIFTASGLYDLNQLMVTWIDSLQGHLPPDLRIESGKVRMGEETYIYEIENEYSARVWKGFIERIPDLEPEERERAGEWIDVNFPDPEEILTPSRVRPLIDRLGEDDTELKEMLTETSNFGSLVFQVDLTGEKPEFSPGAWGFALTEDSYYINILGKAMETEISPQTSAVINYEMLHRWRKALLWQRAPMMLLLIFIVLAVIGLIAALAGCVILGLTASFLKCSLPFKEIFSLSIYALTSVVLVMIIYTLLGLIGLPVSGKLIFLLLLIVYGIYLVGAARRCCSPAAGGGISVE